MGKSKTRDYYEDDGWEERDQKFNRRREQREDKRRKAFDDMSGEHDGQTAKTR